LVLWLGLSALLCALALDVAAAQAAQRPDLVVKVVTVDSGPVGVGDDFTGSSKVKNVGKRRAAASTTDYFLSADSQKGPTDTPAGSGNVPKLKPGKSATTEASLGVNSKEVTDGDYHLIACADGPKEIRESKEGNNCRASESTIVVQTVPPPEPQVTAATATSATSVAVTFDQAMNPATASSDGSQFTIPGLTVSAAGPWSAGNTVVTLTTSSQNPSQNYTVTVAGSVQDAGGTGVDPAHDSANFTGFAPVAHLLLNEVAPAITSSKDLAELRATTGGSVAGMTLQQDVVSPAILATLPATTVATGDLIVVHLNPDAGLISETTSKTDCFDPACYAGAWDVAGGTTGIAHSDHALTVNAASSNLNDAVPFGVPAGADRTGFPPDVQTLQGAGEWIPADCGGAPCDYTTTPTVLDVSVDWSGASSTTGANSAARNSNGDTNQKSDWSVGASSFGALNAGQS
jgi:hypothetical protein